MSISASAIGTLEHREAPLPWPRLGTLYVFSVPIVASIATTRSRVFVAGRL